MDEQRYTYQGDFNIDDTYLQKIRISKALLEPNDARWIKKGQKVTIHGLEISCGYFYLGTKMLDLTLSDADPSLINTDLKVRLLKKGSLNDHGYYPVINYKYFTPTEKGNYLKWLASDRTETDIPHGFVEFYFIGIERRILVDARLKLVSDDEYVELFKELYRLLTSFNHIHPYLLNGIKKLMEVMVILRPNLLPINHLLNHPTIDSILVNCILTVEHEKNIPLTPELALAHYKTTSRITLSPRFELCRDKIYQRFTQIFKRFYPKDQKLSPNQWNSHYSPLNKGLDNSNGRFNRIEWKIKDFSHCSYHYYTIIEECKKDVDSYASYLQLQSSSKSDALATLMMPRGLYDPKGIELIKNFYAWANSKFREKGPFVIDFRELWKFTGLEPIKKLLSKEKKILHLLSYHSGIVIIPHHSNYASKLKIDGKVGLFFDKEWASWKLSSIHQIMELTIYGCILIARTANKEVTTKQINFIEGIIEDNIFLSKLEKKSLKTFLLWQLASPCPSRLQNPYVDNCDDILELAIKSLLIEMAELSGNISYSIMNVLTRLFRMFKMEDDFLSTIPKTNPSKPSLWKSIFSSTVDKVGSPSDGLTFARWVRPGQKVVHRNIEITGGFFYHGDILVAYNQFKQDISLISERTLNYELSPSYHISGYDRDHYWYDRYPSDWADKYLRWLSSDRSDSKVKLDYLILYIGGLERRVIIDSEREDIDDDEYQEIFNEIVRVSNMIRSYQPKLNIYLKHLLEVMAVLRPEVVNLKRITVSKELDNPWLEYQLSLWASKKKPLTTWIAYLVLAKRFNYETDIQLDVEDDAYKWFAILIEKNLPEVNNPPREDYPFTFSYWPLNSSLLRTKFTPDRSLRQINFDQLPISELSDHFYNARYELNEATEYLNDYHSTQEDLCYICLIPRELWSNEQKTKIKNFADWVDHIVEEHHGYVIGSKLLEKVVQGDPSRGEYSPTDLIGIVTDELGYVFAPDPRYYKANFKESNTISIIKYAGNISTIETARVFNRIFLHAKMVAMVGYYSASEKNLKAFQDILDTIITNEKRLNDDQKAVLRAYAYLWLVSRSTIAGISNQAKILTPKQKIQVCQSLISVGLVNGSVNRKSLNRIEKFYEILGQPPKRVMTDILEHKSMLSGFTSTAKRSSGTKTVKLLKKDVNKQKAITAQTQKLLGKIFEDPEDEEETQTNKNQPVGDNYYPLFKELITRERWELSEVETLCKKYNVLVGAFLETLNDKSFELTDEPLIEQEGDFIDLNLDLAPEIESKWQTEK